MIYLYYPVLLFVCFSCFSNNIIYLIPFAGYETDDALFVRDRDGCSKPFKMLREAFINRGYQLQVTTIANLPSNGEKVIVFDAPSKHDLNILQQKYSKQQLVLMIWEPPVVRPDNYDKINHEPFVKILTMLDDFGIPDRYFKFYCPQPSLEMISEIVPFEQKKLCTMIVGNKGSNHPLELYSKRKAAINFFECMAPAQFDLYGPGWSAAEHASYRGTVLCKKEYLSKYKFCLCYENCQNVNGYVTEKIFDCFVAGCIPIYWGGTNITKYIPEECFIEARKFHTLFELYNFIKNMDEKTFQTYINNIRTFLSSSQAQFFSCEYFVKTVLNGVLDDNHATQI